MEQFVNGIREFAASIVNLKPFKNELRILKKLQRKDGHYQVTES